MKFTEIAKGTSLRMSFLSALEMVLVDITEGNHLFSGDLTQIVASSPPYSDHGDLELGVGRGNRNHVGKAQLRGKTKGPTPLQEGAATGGSFR